MYWPNARECRHYMHAIKHRRMADECTSGWLDGDRSIESAVGTIDCDVSYLEDAPAEELKRQSGSIGRIEERIKQLKDQLHQE